MVNQMAIDLSPRWDEFAVYLPAIQEWYSKNVHSDSKRDKSRPFPSGIKLTDLDYLNPKSKLWHYKYVVDDNYLGRLTTTMLAG